MDLKMGDAGMNADTAAEEAHVTSSWNGLWQEGRNSAIDLRRNQSRTDWEQLELAGCLAIMRLSG